MKEDLTAVCGGVLQTCIVTHESNGIDIITALILNDISPLCRYQIEMVLQLKVSSWLDRGATKSFASSYLT